MLVLEYDVAEGVDGDQLLDPVLDGPDQVRAHVDQPDLVGLLEGHGEEGDRLLDRVPRARVLDVGLQLVHGGLVKRVLRIRKNIHFLIFYPEMQWQNIKIQLRPDVLVPQIYCAYSSVLNRPLLIKDRGLGSIIIQANSK